MLRRLIISLKAHRGHNGNPYMQWRTDMRENVYSL